MFTISCTFLPGRKLTAIWREVLAMVGRFMPRCKPFCLGENIPPYSEKFSPWWEGLCPGVSLSAWAKTYRHMARSSPYGEKKPCHHGENFSPYGGMFSPRQKGLHPGRNLPTMAITSRHMAVSFRPGRKVYFPIQMCEQLKRRRSIRPPI